MTLKNKVKDIFIANKTGENDVLIVCGPTGSGKSSLALSLADDFPVEIVSCDSMQIYKFMDIGTAKATKDEQLNVPHHMIDIVYPWTNFSAFQYKEQAEKSIEDILKRGKLPVVCGGTGLYVNSLIDNREYVSDFDESKYSYLDNMSKEEIYDILKKLDPDVCKDTHANNIKRVKRAVMMSLETGKTREERNAESKQTESKFNFVTVCLMPDRQKLYEGIDKRVDKMFEMGLIDEFINVYGIMEKHVKPEEIQNYTSMAAIGYREFLPLRNYTSEDIKNISDAIKLNTRHYAKKQLTWFKKTPGVIMVDM